MSRPTDGMWKVWAALLPGILALVLLGLLLAHALTGEAQQPAIACLSDYGEIGSARFLRDGTLTAEQLSTLWAVPAGRALQAGDQWAYADTGEPVNLRWGGRSVLIDFAPADGNVDAVIAIGSQESVPDESYIAIALRERGWHCCGAYAVPEVLIAELESGVNDG